jgi:hypothetical protein
MIEVGCFEGKNIGVSAGALRRVLRARAGFRRRAGLAWDDKETARAAADKEGATVAPWQDWPGAISKR